MTGESFMLVRVKKDLTHIKEGDIVKALKSQYHKDLVVIWDTDGCKYLTGNEYEITNFGHDDKEYLYASDKKKKRKAYEYAIKSLGKNIWQPVIGFFLTDRDFELHHGDSHDYVKTKNYIEV